MKADEERQSVWLTCWMDGYSSPHRALRNPCSAVWYLLFSSLEKGKKECYQLSMSPSKYSAPQKRIFRHCFTRWIACLLWISMGEQDMYSPGCLFLLFNLSSPVPGTRICCGSVREPQTCSLNRITDLISPLARLPLSGNLTSGLRAQLVI